MAYDPPGIPVTGTAISVSGWGLKVRNTLLATGVAQVTTAGDMTYATALNTLARLAPPAAAGALLRYTTLPAWLALGTAYQKPRVNSGATDLQYFTPAAAQQAYGNVSSTSASYADVASVTANCRRAVGFGWFVLDVDDDGTPHTGDVEVQVDDTTAQTLQGMQLADAVGGNTVTRASFTALSATTVTVTTTATANHRAIVLFSFVATGLSAASHEFAIRVRRSAGAAYAVECFGAIVVVPDQD